MFVISTEAKTHNYNLVVFFPTSICVNIST